MMHKISFEGKPENDSSMPEIVHITYIDATDQPNWSFNLHSHAEEVEISLVHSGRGMVFCSGKLYPVKRGDLVIKNASVLHEEKSDQSDPIGQICIGFKNVASPGFGKNKLISDRIPPIIETKDFFPVLHETAEAMYRLSKANKPGYESVVSQMGMAMLALIQFITPPVNERGDTHPEYHLIDQVVEYLNNHYNENITMDVLADAFHFSPSYLAKRFRERVGYSINQYLLKLRMGEAQRLLVFSNDMGIKEIARICGYEDIHYFYASFRKYAGYAPGEFRTLYAGTPRQEMQNPG